MVLGSGDRSKPSVSFPNFEPKVSVSRPEHSLFWSFHHGRPLSGFATSSTKIMIFENSKKTRVTKAAIEDRTNVQQGALTQAPKVFKEFYLLALLPISVR